MILRARMAVVFFFLFAAVTGLWIGNSQAAEPLRIICWNIEWYPGKRRDATAAEAAAHIDVVRTELKKLNPDIFLAQEIADWQSFAELVEVVPGMRAAALSAFVNEETGEFWPQQLGVASKLPVLAAWSEAWGQGEEIKPRRGFTAAAIRLPGTERLLLVYSVHLKSNRASTPEERELNFRTREESARQLLLHVKQMEEVVFPGRIAGVVIGGDFNTNEDGRFGDQTIAILREAGFHQAWDGVPPEQRHTWRGNNRFEPTTLDHFLTKGLGRTRARLLDAPEAASDHRPLLLEISVPR